MTQKIGIVTENPAIASAIIGKLLELENIENKASFALYSRTLPTNNAFAIYEGTCAMRKVNCQLVVFPELDLEKANRLQNRLPIATSPLLNPVTDANSIDVDLWADFILKLMSRSVSKEDLNIIAKSTEDPSQRVMEAAANPRRHENGLIAIHGGLGHMAGVLSFNDVATKHAGAIFLNSDHNVPNESEYIVEAVVNGGLRIENFPSPVKAVSDSRARILSLKPDSIFMPCNTMHWFGDQIQDRVPKEGFVNIVEEGLRSVPVTGEKINLLALSTNGSAAGRIFTTARDAIGRDDINIIYPTPEEQLIMDGAIFGDILENRNIRAAASKFQRILDNHPCDGVILGCTEVIMCVDKMHGLPNIVIDNAVAGANVAASAVADKIKDRESFWSTKRVSLINGDILQGKPSFIENLRTSNSR